MENLPTRVRADVNLFLKHFLKGAMDAPKTPTLEER